MVLLFAKYKINLSLLRLCIFVVSLLLLTCSRVHSQQFIIEEYGARQGLTSSEIYTLFQDNAGYLWMGTRLGVSKFDGLNFINYTGSDKTRFGKVFSITQDTQNYIWIGAENGLFYYFANKIWQVDLGKSFPDPWIYSVHCSSQNDLWVGTASGPVYISSDELGKIRAGKKLNFQIHGNWHQFADPGNQVLTIETDNKGDVYFGTRSSLIKYEQSGYSILWKSSQSKLEDISEIKIENDGSIYLANQSGYLYAISDNTTDTIREILYSGGMDNFAENYYYILAIDKLFELKNGKLRQVYDLSNNGYANLTDILIDKEKNVWISTWEGLVKLRRNVFTTWLPGETQNLNDIFSIEQTPDGVLVLGGNRGNVITPDGNGFKKYLPDDLQPWDMAEVFGMHFNEDGSAWFGSGYQGISLFKNKKITRFDVNKLGDSHGQDFYYDNLGNFYCLTEGKLTQILNEKDPDKITFKDYNWHVHFGGQYIKLFDHVVLPDNATYFATNFGLVYFDGDTLLKVTSDNDDLNGAIITSIIIDVDQNLWLSTGNVGVFQVRGNKISANVINNFTEASGLLSNAVLDMFYDSKGNIWLAHYNGISLLHRSGLKWEVIKRVDEAEGFLPYDYTYIKLLEDRRTKNMWLATTSGVQTFNPADLQYNTIDANPVISQVLLFNGAFSLENYSSGEKNYSGLMLNPKLPYNKNSITFEFQSVSLTIPEKNTCRYRLAGYDTTWRYADGFDEVTFAALAPGSYEFILQAANNDGIWSINSDRYAFIIKKPFWATWWFIIAAIFLTGLLSYNFYRYRINQLLKINSIRNKIAGDLHDDIGSTLSSIRMYSDIVSDQLQDNNPESKPLLKKMSDNSREMIENMSDIVWAIKPANDAFKNIEVRMFNFATELCNAKNMHLKMQRNLALESLKIPMEQRRDLYLIFKEAVNNAVKYSDCSEIKIDFNKTRNLFLMQISDDGIGFDTKSVIQWEELHPVRDGNGLVNMQLRAKRHKGKLDIISSVGKGTKIILTMPLT